jgi:hypothetical protein
MAGRHKITLDTYSHVIEGLDGGLADAMDEALRGAAADTGVQA